MSQGGNQFGSGASSMPATAYNRFGMSPVPQMPQYSPALTGGLTPMWPRNNQMPQYSPAQTGGLTPMDPQQGVSYSPMDPGTQGRTSEMMGQLNGGGMPVNLMPQNGGMSPVPQQLQFSPSNMFAQNYANVAGFQMPGANPTQPSPPPQFQSLADPPPFSQGGQPSGYRNDGFSTVPSRQGGGYFQGGLGGRYIPNVGNAMNGLDTLARFGLGMDGMGRGPIGAR